VQRDAVLVAAVGVGVEGGVEPGTVRTDPGVEVDGVPAHDVASEVAAGELEQGFHTLEHGTDERGCVDGAEVVLDSQADQQLPGCHQRVGAVVAGDVPSPLFPGGGVRGVDDLVDRVVDVGLFDEPVGPEACVDEQVPAQDLVPQVRVLA
jgi:hypothetical protein